MTDDLLATLWCLIMVILIGFGGDHSYKNKK